MANSFLGPTVCGGFFTLAYFRSQVNFHLANKVKINKASFLSLQADTWVDRFRFHPEGNLPVNSPFCFFKVVYMKEAKKNHYSRILSLSSLYP